LSKYFKDPWFAEVELRAAVHGDRVWYGLFFSNTFPYIEFSRKTKYVATEKYLSFPLNPARAMLGGSPNTYFKFEGFSAGFNSVLLAAHWDDIYETSNVEEALREADTETIRFDRNNTLVQRKAAVFKFQDDNPETSKVSVAGGLCSIAIKGRHQTLDIDVRKQAREAEATAEVHAYLQKKDVVMINALSPDEIICDGTENWAFVQMTRVDIGIDQFTGIKIVKLDVPLCDKTCSGKAASGAP
jgi:hypothetical protein